jgi:hypothetical protein
MNVEIDDDFADELVTAVLKSTYLSALTDFKNGEQNSSDILVEHLPFVLRYFMCLSAYEEFMQRVKEMKENDGH